MTLQKNEGIGKIKDKSESTQNRYNSCLAFFVALQDMHGCHGSGAVVASCTTILLQERWMVQLVDAFEKEKTSKPFKEVEDRINSHHGQTLNLLQTFTNSWTLFTASWTP